MRLIYSQVAHQRVTKIYEENNEGVRLKFSHQFDINVLKQMSNICSSKGFDHGLVMGDLPHITSTCVLNEWFF